MNWSDYEHPLPITAKVRLLEKEEGQYTSYVFKDLDLDNEYYMVTKYPNWIQYELNIGDVGYLTYYIIIGGVSKWYNNDGGIQFSPYNYTHLAFIRFIKDSENNIIRSKDKTGKYKIKIT